MKPLSAPSVRSIDHVHVFVADREAAERWYTNALGFTRSKALEAWATDGGPLTIENADGTVHIALFEGKPEHCRSTIALGTGAAEFVAWQNHLALALGQRPSVVDHELSLSMYFRDIDGNPYEITTYEHQAARALFAKSASDA